MKTLGKTQDNLRLMQSQRKMMKSLGEKVYMKTLGKAQGNLRATLG